MKKNKIFCTLGPASLNAKFLKFIRNKVDLIRLNMSHVQIRDLEKNIKYIKRYTKVPICIDTEGAQIRTKVKKRKFYKKKSDLIISNVGNLTLYPSNVYQLLKKKDILEIGFEGLKVQLIKKNSNYITGRVIESGFLEGNKGVYVSNRKINLDFMTEKDFQAIKIGKKNKVNNYALSFVNNKDDIKKFNKILPKENKIFKIETKSAMQNLESIMKSGNQFLIDRGDLSKEIGIEQIPIAQRKILKIARANNEKKVYIATNFLESMIVNNFPTRAEVNDIFNALELGSAGIVLAAETAIGNYPIDCIKLLRRVFKTFSQNKIKQL